MLAPTLWICGIFVWWEHHFPSHVLSTITALGNVCIFVKSRTDQTGAFLLWLRLELGENELMDSWLSHFSLLFPSLSYIFQAVRRGWAKHSCYGCVVSVAELREPGDGRQWGQTVWGELFTLSPELWSPHFIVYWSWWELRSWRPHLQNFQQF